MILTNKLHLEKANVKPNDENWIIFFDIYTLDTLNQNITFRILIKEIDYIPVKFYQILTYSCKDRHN